MLHRRCIAFVVLFLAPVMALAHPHHGHHVHEHAGFAAGFLHPFTGLDHLLVLLGIGFWMARSQRLPGTLTAGAAVLATLALAFALGVAQGPLPTVEFGILASLLLTGVLVFLGTRLPLVVTAAIAAGFAALHGFAHGAEMAADLSALRFAAGFLLASALLLTAGALAASRIRDTDLERPVGQAAGGAMVAASVYLLLVV